MPRLRQAHALVCATAFAPLLLHAATVPRSEATTTTLSASSHSLHSTPAVDDEPSLAPPARLRLMASNEPAPLRLMARNESLWLVHVAKTAITSLCDDLKESGELNSGEVCFGNVGPSLLHPVSHVRETCYSELVQAGGSFIGTHFMEPFAHVIHQYTECAFDRWREILFTDQRPDVQVPGWCCSGPPLFTVKTTEFNMTAFDAWLDHFGSSWTAEGNEAGANDYKCYNPWNMQARHFQRADAEFCTAGEAEVGSHYVYSTSGLTPDGEYASTIASSNAALGYVGLAELYDESWCLLQYLVHQELPADKCDCATLGEPGLHLYYSHGIEVDNKPTGASDLPAAMYDKIDAYTKVDQQLYSVAVTRTLEQLCAVQIQTGGRLVCPHRVALLKNKTSHLPAMSDTIDRATGACA